VSTFPTDVVVDTLYEGALIEKLKARPGVAIVIDPEDPEGEVPFFTREDFMVVRVAPGTDVDAFVEEIRQQMRTMLKVVGVYERRPGNAELKEQDASA
jgi:hypothetical protein